MCEKFSKATTSAPQTTFFRREALEKRGSKPPLLPQMYGGITFLESKRTQDTPLDAVMRHYGYCVIFKANYFRRNTHRMPRTALSLLC